MRLVRGSSEEIPRGARFTAAQNVQIGDAEMAAKMVNVCFLELQNN